MRMTKTSLAKSNFFEYILPELNFYYYKKVFSKMKLNQTQEIIIPILLRGENLDLMTINLKVFFYFNYLESS